MGEKKNKKDPNSWDGKIRQPRSEKLVPKPRPAHFVEKGDPATNGPFLDDVNAAKQAAYEAGRKQNNVGLEDSEDD